MAGKPFNLADALRGVSDLDTGGGPRMERIDIDRLHDDPNNFYSLSDLEGLAENIELVGLQQPVLVRPDPERPGDYIIVSGHRRRAAIRMLVEDGREDLRRVPCLVETPAASAAMQELRLIFANSGTRKLTDPEIAAQADRVKDLLYELQKEGVEFPGRMRDHVAEAVQVSKSKLARLSVIQQGLVSNLKLTWERGGINESAAYALARMPAGLQMRVFVANGKKVPEGGTLETVLKAYTNGARWEHCGTCPDGKECYHNNGFLKAYMSHTWTACDGKTCCLDCPHGAQCQYSPCDCMCGKAKAVRKDRAQTLKFQAAERLTAAMKKAQEATIPNARRVLRAIDAAGLRDRTTVEWDKYGSVFSVGDIRKWAAGEFPAWPYSVPQLAPEKLSSPIEAAKTLKCSTDYLLGLSDDLHPVAPAAPEGYRTGPGPDGQRLDAVGVFDLGDGLELYRRIISWDGKQWTFLSELAFKMDLVCWYPIPEVPNLTNTKEDKNHD